MLVATALQTGKTAEGLEKGTPLQLPASTAGECLEITDISPGSGRTGGLMENTIRL